MDELDLHNVRHKKAEKLVHSFLYSCDLPAKVITGNSLRMQNIVKEVAKKYNLKVTESTYWNLGALIITD